MRTKIFETIKLNTKENLNTKEFKVGDLYQNGKNHIVVKELIDSFESKSNLHRSICENMSSQFSGDGFKFGDEIKGNKRETFNDILFKCALDLKVYGYFFIGVEQNGDKTAVAKVYYIDAAKMLVNEFDEENDVQYYSLVEDPFTFKPKVKKVYQEYTEDPEDIILNSQVYCYMPHSINFKKYSKVNYISCLKWLEIDYQSTEYKLKNYTNRFSAGTIISVIDDTYNEEEKETISKQIQKSFSGAENNQNMFVEFVPDKEHTTMITPLPIVSEKGKHDDIMSEKLNEIMFAHSITNPILVGIKVGTGFSNNADELKTSYELYHHDVIMPKQKQLLKAFNIIYKNFYNKLSKIEKLSIVNNLPFGIGEKITE